MWSSQRRRSLLELSMHVTSASAQWCRRSHHSSPHPEAVLVTTPPRSEICWRLKWPGHGQSLGDKGNLSAYLSQFVFIQFPSCQSSINIVGIALQPLSSAGNCTRPMTSHRFISMLISCELFRYDSPSGQRPYSKRRERLAKYYKVPFHYVVGLSKKTTKLNRLPHNITPASELQRTVYFIF